MTSNYVVCETVHAIVLHVRRGEFQPCGKQDTDALCGAKPAWDTKIPLAAIKIDERGICQDCARLLEDAAK